jgi:hypothetical protein
VSEPQPERVRVRVRVRTGRRKSHPARKAIVRAGYGVLVVVLLVIAWLSYTGLRARSELNAARAHLNAAKSALAHGDVRRGEAEVADAASLARSAKHKTGDLVWRGAAAVPWVGQPAKTVRGLTGAADTLAARTLPTALRADDALDPAKVRPHGDQIDLALLTRAQRPLASAAGSASSLRGSVAALPSVGYLPPVAHARDKLLREITDLSSLLSRAHTAAEVVPPMLGADGTRRYFLGFQTNAEARGTGGLAGAFAIIRATNGRVVVEKVAADSELRTPKDFSVDLGHEYDAVYGPYATTRFWGNTNISPDFPDVMRIWTAWYERLHPDVHLDGALATDPVALSYVLKSLGPVNLPDGEHVTSDNVVQLLEVDTYARFHDDIERKAFQVGVAQAVLDEVLHTHSSAAKLLTAIGDAASEHRVLVASKHKEEDLIAPTEVGGALERHAGPTAYVVVDNAGGNKLDYYLQRSVRYVAGSCTGKTRKSTVTITLTNTAPTSGLPPLVRQRLDLPRNATYEAGTSNSLVWLFATRGASYDGGTLDGRPLLLGQRQNYGHQLFRTTLELRPGQTRTLVIHLVEPTIAGAPYIPVQPLVLPMPIHAKVPTCA